MDLSSRIFTSFPNFVHVSSFLFSVDQGLLAGWPSYITQEEFNRYNGFWWCPVKSNTGKIVGFLDTVAIS